jgi:hypothetical protein
MDNNYRDGSVSRMKLMGLRIARSVAFATWVYSLLFLMYLTLRLTLNSSHVRLDDLFIDRVPFFTFLTTGICLLVINLVSLAMYLAIRRNYGLQKGPISRQEAGQSFIFMIKRSFLTLIVWSFSISIWSYLTYLSLANPPSPPYWPISMMMFVIGYICMVYMAFNTTAIDTYVATGST